MLLAQSEKSPLHDRLGRAFRETAAGAVPRNATIPMDGQGENPPLYSGRSPVASVEAFFVCIGLARSYNEGVE